ncbi:serine/threonine-protein kinase [Paractinoplanes lichenicola]|uniref:Serine/threonine protein kinase n=1 Tax=Paractinoplanes lichenicola TaxID=2802976 RepID=A0ABS1VZB3_9ACTN|nr:serine/threonine-protein kinase [Actinoplanes lichenicola]MBL7259638.1 serine/threonine protein kinase [Actinoplanes lichenicola]
MADPLRPTDPPSVGPYRLLSRLGEGGMGSVYLAEAPSGRLVAVKVIRAEYAHEEHFRARFRSEVSRARQVPPFCTAEVLDADPDHATPYLVVEYVDGPTLSEVVAENGPLHGGSLHGVAVGVATALAAIHGAGVIHRDLKPRNVLFALGQPKVIDFGIARPLEPTSFHTRAEEVVGTLAYMAPERLDPDTESQLTPAVDVFAWGAVVAYAGNGRTPFGGDTPAVTAARILTQPPRVENLPPYLAEMVNAALDKQPENRPTAGELLDRLLVTGAPSGPPLPAPLQRSAEAAAQQSGRFSTTSSRKRRSRRSVVLLAAGATAMAALAGVGFRTLSPAAAPAPAPAPASSAVAPPVVPGPSIFDPLRKESIFQTTDYCSYRNGLRVEAAKASVCGPYTDTVFPASQSVAVTATLGNARSCATISFRAENKENDEYADGYRAAVCPGAVRLASLIDGLETVIATAPVATTTGTAHELRLVADDEQATLAVDGKEAVRGPLTESSLTGGRVLLGAVSTGGGRATVTFTDAQLRSGDATGEPAFMTGDAQLTAGMHMLYDRGKVAILEPAEYVTGAEYCERFALPATSPQCAKKLVPVNSGTRVSLPIVAEPRYLDFRHDPAKCLDPKTHAGTCAVSFDTYVTVSSEISPRPSLVTIRNGQVATVARINLE